MSQQIPASIPSPVSPAVAAPQAAPSADMGSTAYPQWVATTQGAPSVAMPQAPSPATPVSVPSTSSQSNQFPSTSSPSNPWEAALTSLDRVVSRISPSLSQAPQYPQYQTVPQGIQQPVPTSQAQPWLFQAPTDPQTSYSSGSTTQTSYPTSTAPQQAPQLSEETAAVVNHFGIEAPAVLNQYAVTLEDALIQQNETLEAMATRAGAMEHILTDPDQLADYTNRFFTEVYPVDDAETEVVAPSQNYQPQYDQFPSVPAAASAAGRPVDPNTQWDGFSQTMERSPDQAWRYLSQMSPDALRSKLLFLDNG